MAVLDELIVNVPYVEEVEAQLRDEERKKTGRYLAVTAVLLIIGIGLYHTVPKITSKITALVCAPVILLLYLLWLWYASQKRKHYLKRIDVNVESQAKAVLENLNNHSSKDETVKLTNENVKKYLEKHKLGESNINNNNNNNNNNCEAREESSSRKSSGNCEILIRTYSIA